MAATTVNLSFQKELLDDIDAEARREARTRSELIREAARIYLDRQRRWERVFHVGAGAAEAGGLTEGAVREEIGRYRKSRRNTG